MPHVLATAHPAHLIAFGFCLGVIVCFVIVGLCARGRVR